MSGVSPIPELSAVSQALAEARAGQPQAWKTLLTLDTWTIYTDGSAPIKNPGGAIGFSAVFVLSTDQAWEVLGGVPGRTSDPATSNNRAEISGVVAILETLHSCTTEGLTLPKQVEIVCDSQYVVNCAQGRWKKHKNRDLWARFDQLQSVCRRHKVKLNYRWTRAHVGTKWNERADVLAKEGAMRMVGRASDNSSNGESRTKPQYSLKLCSKMAGKSQSEAVYELATPQRSRRRRMEVDDVLTLDEAEYFTLRQGLQDLLETLQKANRSPRDFTVRVESARELMLKQLDGQYAVKSERLQPLYEESKVMLKYFGGVELEKVGKAEARTLFEAE